jgi:sigma-B regulation protein RsbU (phosphoserine phosphatase)
MVYRKGTDVMHPGDILHMYTDGVTEEMDTDGQLFSDERLAALISTQAIDSVEAAVDKTISAVKSFRGEKDAEDDVTVLAIQFFGAPMKASAAGLHVIVKNELSEITTVQERFQEFGKTHGYSKDLERKMDMIIDELLGNVILYAFSESGEHEIEITAEQVRNRLTVTISDDGVPFNPLLNAPPEISLATRDRTIGGLGILLVRKTADDILYQRRIDKNVVTLIIHVDQSDDAS